MTTIFFPGDDFPCIRIIPRRLEIECVLAEMHSSLPVEQHVDQQLISRFGMALLMFTNDAYNLNLIKILSSIIAHSTINKKIIPFMK